MASTGRRMNKSVIFMSAENSKLLGPEKSALNLCHLEQARQRCRRIFLSPAGTLVKFERPHRTLALPPAAEGPSIALTRLLRVTE